MTWLPAVATDAMKTPLDTPVPEYVPPVGVPVANTNESALVHLAANAVFDTTGKALTVTVVVSAALLQPDLSSIT